MTYIWNKKTVMNIYIKCLHEVNVSQYKIRYLLNLNKSLSLGWRRRWASLKKSNRRAFRKKNITVMKSIDHHSLVVVPLAVKFAVPQKAGARERVPASRAPHTLLVPEAASDSEQESVCDVPVASRTHCVLIHICNDGQILSWWTFLQLKSL